MDNYYALQQAVDYFESQTALARELGVSKQAVNSWLKKRNKLSIEMAIRIEKITKNNISRQDLRPDIFQD